MNRGPFTVVVVSHVTYVIWHITQFKFERAIAEPAPPLLRCHYDAANHDICAPDFALCTKDDRERNRT